jgi:hypothetical protein
VTEDQVLERGLKAEAILSLDVFCDLFDEVQNDITKQMLATSPEDTKTRETLYATYNGMRAFTNTLNGYRLAMLELVEARELEQENSDN